MANVRDRLGAIRAGTPMSAPGTSNFNVGGGMPNGSMSGSGFSASVAGDVSIQATGIVILALIALVILGERLGR